MVDLLDRSEDFYMHNRRYSASVIMQVVYGHRIPECTLPSYITPRPRSVRHPSSPTVSEVSNAQGTATRSAKSTAS